MASEGERERYKQMFVAEGMRKLCAGYAQATQMYSFDPPVSGGLEKRRKEVC